MLIPTTEPLDLANTLESGQAFRWMRESPPRPEQWQRWFIGVLFGNVVRIRQVRKGIEFHCEPDDEAALAPSVRDYLRLRDDLEGICRSISLDDRINAAIAQYRGMRILRQDPWECLVSFICSATSNIPRIGANVEDMSTHFGCPIEVDGRLRHTFPTPGELAVAGETRLRHLRLGFRAKYVAAVAGMVADGEVDLFALREAPYEEALDALTSLPGVGDKVANCVLLFSLDKLEAFPVDVWIRRALKEWYFSDTGKRPSDKDLRLWAQDYFGSFAGYANQYLFHRRRLQDKA